MSTDTETDTDTDTESQGLSTEPGHDMPGTAPEAAHEHGLPDSGYIKIAILLGILTAIEVSTYYVDFGPLFLPTLIILMVIKFYIVVAFFMHLKFDNRIFTWMFYSGVFLAVFVYVAALATFHFFSGV